MKTTKKAARLLKEIGRIEFMERGKVCRMGKRNHYNHQTWKDGRNVVHYVPQEELEDLEEAVEGYAHFIKLTQQYADEMIRISRMERKKRVKNRSGS